MAGGGAQISGTASTNGITVTYTPTLDFYGVDVFAYTVSDGSLTVTVAVSVTVDPVNDPPTILDIPGQSTQAGTPIGPIGFVVGDVETLAGGLTLFGASSNSALVPDNNIVFGGSGANRTVTITPVADLTGTVTITITVDDGADVVSDHFALRVVAAQRLSFQIFLPTIIGQHPEDVLIGLANNSDIDTREGVQNATKN